MIDAKLVFFTRQSCDGESAGTNPPLRAHGNQADAVQSILDDHADGFEVQSVNPAGDLVVKTFVPVTKCPLVVALGSIASGIVPCPIPVRDRRLGKIEKGIEKARKSFV